MADNPVIIPLDVDMLKKEILHGYISMEHNEL